MTALLDLIAPVLIGAGLIYVITMVVEAFISFIRGIIESATDES